jgi:hypothetical protein
MIKVTAHEASLLFLLILVHLEGSILLWLVVILILLSFDLAI